MTMPVIDINADIGEREGEAGIDADLEIVAAVSSVNVACGSMPAAPRRCARCAPPPYGTARASARTSPTSTVRGSDAVS